MSAKIEPGTYQTKTTAATVYESEKGAVMCRISTELGLTGGICLIQKDGTLRESGFKDVQAILNLPGPWDWNTWSRPPEDFAGHAVEAVVEKVQGQRGEFSSITYLNPPGGGRMVQADAKALAAKYGAKTRALFGGAPATAPKPPVVAPKPPPAPPAAAVPPSTMEACWDAWLKAGNDGDADKWYADVKKHTGKEQTECSPADWGKMLRALDDIPY